MWNAVMNAKKVVVLVMFVHNTVILPIRSDTDSHFNDSVSVLRPQNLSGNVSGIEYLTTTEASSYAPLLEETTRRSTELNRGISTNSTENVNAKVSQNTTPKDGLALCMHENRNVMKKPLLKCQCLGSEVLVDGNCQPSEGVVIPVRHHKYYSKLENISNYNVVIQDLSCDPEKYIARNFSEGQFHLRIENGNVRDVLLTEGAGKLEGQRLNNYCLSHYLDENKYLTWMLKACSPIPSVPRCCSHGYAMKDGSCRAVKTPELLEPPIVLKPHSTDSVDWPNLPNYLNNLTCQSKPMRTIPLGNSGSHLLLLANGLSLTWKPNEDGGPYDRTYFSPNYCVDGVSQSGGRVEYLVSFCHMTLKEMHDKACGEMPCIRKCCGDSYSYCTTKKKCLPDSNSTFSLLDISKQSSFNVAYGTPLCKTFVEVEEEISLDRDGQLTISGGHYSSTEYCLDIFFDKSHRKTRALICKGYDFSWDRARRYVLPVSKIISLIFLTISIICHLLVPKLLEHGGIHQLCHIISLTIAFSMGFTVNVFHKYIRKHYLFCFWLVITMQYGYLAMMFWLNIICFEVWRKLRKLTKFQASKKYPEFIFMLYGWGIPSIICIVTVIMQFANPHQVKGEIRPYIGTDNNCWFTENAGKFFYFYLHVSILSLFSAVLIVHAYYYSKIILRNSREAANDLRNIGRSTDQMSDHVRDFHQKFKLFALSVICWTTEALSWNIPPIEIWAITDIFNALQGLFIFIILMTNSNKRKLLQKRCPLPFELARRCLDTLCRCRKETSERNNQVSNTSNSFASDNMSLSTTVSHVSS